MLGNRHKAPHHTYKHKDKLFYGIGKSQWKPQGILEDNHKEKLEGILRYMQESVIT